MAIILIIFCVILYFVIGAVIVGLFDLDWLAFELYLAWPIIGPILLILRCCVWISDEVNTQTKRVKDRLKRWKEREL